MGGSATPRGRLGGGAARTWADPREPIVAPLWQAMLDTAGVGPGARLLDAGCGAGGASLLAAQRGALVNGLDASEALLAIARRRVPDGDFRVGDLEVLPYADSTFDAVIAADVLPYTARPAVALGELARISRRGASVVVAVGVAPDPGRHAMTLALRETSRRRRRLSMPIPTTGHCSWRAWPTRFASSPSATRSAPRSGSSLDWPWVGHPRCITGSTPCCG